MLKIKAYAFITNTYALKKGNAEGIYTRFWEGGGRSGVAACVSRGARKRVRYHATPNAPVGGARARHMYLLCDILITDDMSIHRINREINPIVTMAEAPVYIAGELRCSKCELKNFQCYECRDRQTEENKQKRKRTTPKSPDKKLIEEHPHVMKTMKHALENAEESRKEEARKQSILRQEEEELKALQKEKRKISALQKKADKESAKKAAKIDEFAMSDVDGDGACPFPFSLAKLGDDVYVRMTATKGRGVFAARKFLKGTMRLEYMGNRSFKVGGGVVMTCNRMSHLIHALPETLQEKLRSIKYNATWAVSVGRMPGSSLCIDGCIASSSHLDGVANRGGLGLAALVNSSEDTRIPPNCVLKHVDRSASSFTMQNNYSATKQETQHCYLENTRDIDVDEEVSWKYNHHAIHGMTPDKSRAMPKARQLITTASSEVVTKHQLVKDPVTPPKQKQPVARQLLKPADPPHLDTVQSLLNTGDVDRAIVISSSEGDGDDEGDDGDEDEDEDDEDDEVSDVDEVDDDGHGDVDDDEVSEVNEDDGDGDGDVDGDENEKKKRQKQKSSFEKAKPSKDPSSQIKKRNSKFAPKKGEILKIFTQIATDSPWQHTKGGQGACWNSHITYCKNTLGLRCMKAKFTLKAFRSWAEKMCSIRFQKRVKESQRSGGGTFSSDDDVDLVAADWHEQKLASLDGAKKTTAQAEVLKNYACGKRNVEALATQIRESRKKTNLKQTPEGTGKHDDKQPQSASSASFRSPSSSTASTTPRQIFAQSVLQQPTLADFESMNVTLGNTIANSLASAMNTQKSTSLPQDPDHALLLASFDAYNKDHGLSRYIPVIFGNLGVTSIQQMQTLPLVAITAVALPAFPQITLERMWDITKSYLV